jgi:hypothetical protein
MPMGEPKGENVFNIGAEQLAPSIEYVKDPNSATSTENVPLNTARHYIPESNTGFTTPAQITDWNKGITEQISAMREEVLRNVA